MRQKFYLQDSELHLLNGSGSSGGLSLEMRGEQLLKREHCILHELKIKTHRRARCTSARGLPGLTQISHQEATQGDGSSSHYLHCETNTIRGKAGNAPSHPQVCMSARCSLFSSPASAPPPGKPRTETETASSPVVIPLLHPLLLLQPQIKEMRWEPSLNHSSGTSTFI